MSELLESLNSLVDCVYELYGPAGMREIDTPQLAEYHSQERQLNDPDKDRVALHIYIMNERRTSDKLQAELEQSAQLSNQLDEARRRIDIQGRGSAEERKHFSEYKAGYEEAKERLASENMDLRLKRDILNAQNQKLQTDVANEATNRKGLQVKIEGMHKELQGCRTTVEEAEKEILAQSNRAEEAEKKTRVQENTIQILASMCMKFRERRDNSESFKTSQADASGVCEINKLRQQLDETRRQLSAAQSRASSLQLENESLDGTTGSFAAQVGFEGPPTSPVASRRILPRVRPRKESFSQSQSNTTSGEVSSAFQTLAWPRATLSLLSENDEWKAHLSRVPVTSRTLLVLMLQLLNGRNPWVFQGGIATGFNQAIFLQPPLYLRSVMVTFLKDITEFKGTGGGAHNLGFEMWMLETGMTWFDHECPRVTCEIIMYNTD
ncbi:hypothetical protein BKA61DRAFT_680716 [Leptodontidium sp. MPI-SDFR-AT-0119]|nr:hypothetical protein BKA61DRAFT_680716 [Leptodontidium sp. MPI-SDFR-AT-0119]